MSTIVDKIQTSFRGQPTNIVTETQKLDRTFVARRINSVAFRLKSSPESHKMRILEHCHLKPVYPMRNKRVIHLVLANRKVPALDRALECQVGGSFALPSRDLRAERWFSCPPVSWSQSTLHAHGRSLKTCSLSPRFPMRPNSTPWTWLGSIHNCLTTFSGKQNSNCQVTNHT